MMPLSALCENLHLSGMQLRLGFERLLSLIAPAIRLVLVRVVPSCRFFVTENFSF
jgi:hypothetical protein